MLQRFFTSKCTLHYCTPNYRKFSRLIVTFAFLVDFVSLQTVSNVQEGTDTDTDKALDSKRHINLGINYAKNVEAGLCGRIFTASGDMIMLGLGLTVSDNVFEKIHVKKLKNSVLFPFWSFLEHCVIKVCGFTSYGKRINDSYIGSNDDYGGCFTSPSDSATNTSKMAFFNELYNASSVSCGCTMHDKKYCETSCKTELANYTWGENECARLYLENNCKTCYFYSIQLLSFENYTTDNSHHVLSMIVRDGCEVRFRSPALKKMYWYKDVQQPIVYKSGPTEKGIISSFQKGPEYFECVCDSQPTPTTTTTPSPKKSFDDIYATFGYVVGGVGVFSVVVLLLTGLVMWKSGRIHLIGTSLLVNSESQETISTFVGDTPKEDEPAAVVSVVKNENIGLDNDLILNMPLNPAFETFPEQFEVQQVIGKGHFGQVSVGTLKVAIKTVKADVNSSDRESCITLLDQEIKILSYLGSHPNVVRFLNAYIGDYINGEIFLILEFCEGGSLESHLKSTVARRIQEILCERDLERMGSAMKVDDYLANKTNGGSEPSNHDVDKNDLEKLDPETLRQLYKWCSQIACGMMHLESKKVVHADLATRNVLLTSNLVAKIADFGLSKRLCVNDYASNGENSLPIRWTSPECIALKKCTSKSDVWSFGITGWEMFNLGKLPYEGMDCAQVVAFIVNGGRLDCPQYATEDVYSKLINCWNACPEKRPSFKSLQKYFDRKIHEVLVPD